MRVRVPLARDVYIDVNDSRLFFDVTGPGWRPKDGALRPVPTLLLLHGGPGADHSAVKAPFFPLAEHYQLVWLDHRGNGRSDQSDPSHWNLDQWADDIRAFCDALGIVKPIVLGQSFGGVVTQAYGIRHPDHAGKLIISSIGARWDFELSMRRFRERGGAEIEAIARNFWGRMDLDDIAIYRERCFPIYASNPAGAGARAMVLNKEDVMRHFLAPQGVFQTMDLRADLAKITCPTLVLAGRDDPVIPWELSQELAQALVSSETPVERRFVCFDGCGHGIWRDKPEPSLALIRAFIDGDDEAVAKFAKRDLQEVSA
jgi:pimeloyl-ACP methyl ester carboxylesterase